MMRPITLLQPGRLALGKGCSSDCAPHLQRLGLRRARLVKAPPTLSLARTVADSLAAHSLQVEIYDGIDRKPTLSMFQTALAAAKSASPDAIVGLGGGSPLDVAKLIPAFLNREQRVEDAYGIDLLTGLYERAF